VKRCDGMLQTGQKRQPKQQGIRKRVQEIYQILHANPS